VPLKLFVTLATPQLSEIIPEGVQLLQLVVTTAEPHPPAPLTVDDEPRQTLKLDDEVKALFNVAEPV
jgi:hypothetical protein